MTVSICKLVRNAGQEMKFEKTSIAAVNEIFASIKKKVNADNCLSLQ